MFIWRFGHGSPSHNVVGVNDTEAPLGGRLELLAEANLDAMQRAVWDRLVSTQVPEARHAGFTARTDDGRFIGPFNAFLRWPGPGGALLDWARAQVQEETLSPLVRQVVTLAVGAVWKAPFEVEAHIAGARAAGATDAAITAVLSRQDSDDLPAEAAVARRLADALLVAHRVDPGLYAESIELLQEPGINAVAHLVGQYVTISALLIAFDVPATGPTPVDSSY
ncbi:carboxymuconolactone decarboxylase family protein [Glaciibacter flavus]|uniref:carboxymuconolactone decarboxylase family protein n=1 Tax=Orlajensenia flava TaxID=2565934 RepID=UPI003B0066AD